MALQETGIAIDVRLARLDLRTDWPHLCAMRTLPVFLSLVLALPAATASGEPAHGLLWNRSGLSAGFPLMLLPKARGDAVLRLIEPRSGEAVLAAFADDGKALRLLVPPGTYRLRVTTGEGWLADSATFASATENADLPEPLRFGVTGAGRKAGWTVDLRGDPPTITPRDLCQMLLRDPDSLQAPLTLPLTIEQLAVPRYEVITRLCD